MNDKEPVASERPQLRRFPLPGRLILGAMVVLLAVAALLLPRSARRSGHGLFLVIDPMGLARAESVFEPLVQWINAEGGLYLQLIVIRSAAELATVAWQEVDLVFCPDAVALSLPNREFAALAAGRRHPPHHLRPRSALVWRRSQGYRSQPWVSCPERTILGDSLTLAGAGAARLRISEHVDEVRSGLWADGCMVGPDPFDHGPALHALRFGCFDYAVVRKLDAERFLETGLLDPSEWGVTDLTDPLPDVVVLVTKRWSAHHRVRLGEMLLGLGRHLEKGDDGGQAVLAGLDEIGLVGFNVLLENDLERLRRQFHPCWPRLDF